LSGNRSGIGLLVRQVGRALVFYSPTTEFALQALVEPVTGASCRVDQNAWLRLYWVPVGHPARASGNDRVIRTQLVQPGQTPHDELARLLAFSVVTDLVCELDARIRLAERWEASRPAVSVQLPVELACAEASVATPQ
jgi:hypothetical protein